jgi:NAD+ kinase
MRKRPPNVIHLHRFHERGAKSAATAAIVMGGDGTMLALPASWRRGAPLIGINQGPARFHDRYPYRLHAARAEELLSANRKAKAHPAVSHGPSRRRHHRRRHGRQRCRVVCSGAGAGMVELKVMVDGRLHVQPTPDGFDHRHPTGSTAYRVGGPAAIPRSVVLVPIAPCMRCRTGSIVIPGFETVVEIVSRRDVSVNFDMQTFASLLHGDQIVIERRPTASPLHPPLELLRHPARKLHWNEYPSGDGKR